jgi:hypothetical protein
MTQKQLNGTQGRAASNDRFEPDASDAALTFDHSALFVFEWSGQYGPPFSRSGNNAVQAGFRTIDALSKHG